MLAFFFFWSCMSKLPKGWLTPDKQTFVAPSRLLLSVNVILGLGVQHIIDFSSESVAKAGEGANGGCINSNRNDDGCNNTGRDNGCIAKPTQADITLTCIPLVSADALKQVNIMAYDKALRVHHGKTALLIADTVDMVGAAVALRAGWLRGRKMDTCLERGRAHGLCQGSVLEQEVTMRLLVPR